MPGNQLTEGQPIAVAPGGANPSGGTVPVIATIRIQAAPGSAVAAGISALSLDKPVAAEATGKATGIARTLPDCGHGDEWGGLRALKAAVEST